MTVGLSSVLLSIALIPAATQPTDRDADAPGYMVVRSYLDSGAEESHSHEEQSLVAAPYVVNTNLWDAASIPLEVTFDSNVTPPIPVDMTALLRDAVAVWNDSTASSFAFVAGGAADGGGGSCDSVIKLDGINSVTFAPLHGKLGLTCTVFYGTEADAELVEFDLILASDGNFWSNAAVTPSGKFDLASTLLHELGHAAGLGHGADGTVMDETLDPGTQRRALTAADMAGLAAAYPASAVAQASVAELFPAGTTMYRLRVAAIAQD